MLCRHYASDITISNYNRKLTQLNKIIFDFQFEIMNLRFQRAFLHEYFHPKITGTIQALRGHVAKMQQTAFEDHGFITDRIHRFYTRKYETLKKEIPSFFKSAALEHHARMKELGSMIAEALQTITSLSARLQDSRVSFNDFCAAAMDLLKRQIHAAHAHGTGAIDEFLLFAHERQAQFVSGAAEQRNRLVEKHRLTVSLLMEQESVQQCDGALRRLLKERIGELRSAVFESKIRLSSVRNDGVTAIGKGKQQIERLVREIQHATADAATDRASLRERMLAVYTEGETLIAKLRNERISQSNDFQSERQQKQAELKALMDEQLRVLDSERSRRQKLESDVTNLIQLFQSEFGHTTTEFEAQEKQKDGEIQALEKRVSEWQTSICDAAVQSCATTDQEVAGLVGQQISEIRSEMERMEAERRGALMALQQQERKSTDARERLCMEIGEIMIARENLVKSSAEFFQNLDRDMASKLSLQKAQFDNGLAALRDHLERDYQEFALSHRQAIEVARAAMSEELDRHRKQFIGQRIDIGTRPSAEEPTQYEAEYRRLLAVRKREGRFVPPPQWGFEQLAGVYADLQKELVDRRTRVECERRLFAYEWTERIEAERAKAGKTRAVRPSSRARDGVRQSLQQQIVRIKALRIEKEQKIREVLGDLKQGLSRAPALGPEENGDSLELEGELEAVQNDNHQRTEAAAREAAFDVAQGMAAMESLQIEFQRQIDTIRQFMVMQENLYRKESRDLEQMSQNTQGQFAEQELLVGQIFSEQSDHMKAHQALLARRLMDENEAQRQALVWEQQSFEANYRAACNDLEAEVAMVIQNSKRTNATFYADLNAKIEVLTEKLERISQENQNAKQKCQWSLNATRPKDLELIEHLQGILRTKNLQLASLTKDLTQYKGKLKNQEIPINGKPRVMPTVDCLPSSGRASNPAVG
jgi:predicted  nucleic acid-binding Zn-ribbon protein